MVSDEDMVLLSNLIIENIKKDFSGKFLSKNLINSIVTEKTEQGVSIIIPAEIYNMYRFFKDGVIISTGKGSYASEIDINGSAFMWYPAKGEKGKRKLMTPRNHIGYVDKAINNALETWRGMMQDKYNISSIQGL